MAIRHINSVDSETGEVLDGALVAVKRKVPFMFDDGWAAFGRSELFGALERMRRVDDMRVFSALMRRIDFGNVIAICQADIARDLDMYPQQVSKAIAHLVAAGVLLEGKKIGTSKTYIANPEMMWRGSPTSQRKMLRDRRENKRKAPVVSLVRGKKP